jgi:hypothetical protein
MAVYAVISKDGTVTDLVGWEGPDSPEADLFPKELHASMVRTGAGPLPAVGWTYDGRAFVEPAPDLDAAKAAAIDEIRADELRKVVEERAASRIAAVDAATSVAEIEAAKR